MRQDQRTNGVRPRGGRGRLFDRVDQFVERRDRLVELQAIDRFANGGICPVELAAKLLVHAVTGVLGRCEPPDALDEARGALDPGFRPFQVAFGWAVREHEPAHRVGAITGDDWLRVDRVPLRL